MAEARETEEGCPEVRALVLHAAGGIRKTQHLGGGRSVVGWIKYNKGWLGIRPKSRMSWCQIIQVGDREGIERGLKMTLRTEMLRTD